MNDIYLDHNATTPLDPEVLDAMLPFLAERFGNAASSHQRGRAAAGAVAKARDQLAGLLGVSPQSIVWTSGATEGLNTVIKGIRGYEPSKNLVVTAGEHKAVLDSARWLSETTGAELRIVPLTRQGSPDLDALTDLTDDRTALVVAMSANNETGAITDIRAIVEIARIHGAWVLSDTTQQVGKLPLDIEASGVDFAVASAHKMYGPQGVGALVAASPRARKGVEPLIHGGGHQGGLRSGTINVAGVVGFGAAADLAQRRLNGDVDRLEKLRDRLETELISALGGVSVNVSGTRLPNTANIRIHGVDADALIVNCPEVAFSSGSACTSAVPTPSHVLTAMGLSAEEAEQSIRISVGRFTTPADVDGAVESLARAVDRLRRLTA